MKTEFTDVTETQKTLTIEIPTDVVDAEINRVARGFTREARIPGFRPGKVPARIVKQRFRDQIRHEVMHGLIPRAVDQALQERGIEPVDTPGIKDVVLEEGQPLVFTAAIETVPPFDPGDLSTIAVTRAPTVVTDEAMAHTLQHLRERAATYESIEDRAISDGDTAALDIERTTADGETDRHEDVSVEIGSSANPPGFDANLIGLNVGDRKTFTVRFPEEYTVAEMANTDVSYAVVVKGIRRRVLPELDDEFAKDLGEFDSLQALRDRVRADMQAEADEQSRRQVRTDVLTQLADRVTFEVPAALLDREMDRRLEEFARQLVQQKIDPRQAGIDWVQFREAQRDPARAAVASAIALDEIARREQITVSDDEVAKEVERFALQTGRTPTALRAQLEKEGVLARLTTGIRREKTVEHAVSRAQVSGATGLVTL